VSFIRFHRGDDSIQYTLFGIDTLQLLSSARIPRISAFRVHQRPRARFESSYRARDRGTGRNDNRSTDDELR
jgi:hypothetical protein